MIPSLSCGEHLLLRCDRNSHNSFPNSQRKEPSSRATRRKRGSYGCGRDPRASSRGETGMLGNFLISSKGVKDPSDFPEVRCIIPETHQRKWTSSILEVRTSFIFSSCSRCSRLRTVRKGTRSGGVRTGQSPFELLGSLSGFLSLRCQSLRPCEESCLEHEVSSPVLTWIVGYFWCLPR